ncbi:MAG: PfkB family carbohydrate kinase [Candidatus Kariarchaeaceae archaeon]|jgi:bifunctional ADP-heptose synthase (sugar kinase/adenylyltransferase)
MRVLIVGHISDDFRGGKLIRGGPPLYQIPILKALGCEIHLITATDDSSKLPDYSNCTYSVIKSKFTTTFKFHKRNVENYLDDRELELVHRAENIPLEYIKKNTSAYDFVIISPIAGEISKPGMLEAAQKGNHSFLDMQGMIRSIGENGSISINLDEKDLKWALTNFSVVKLSESEFTLDNFSNPYQSQLIITKSGHGFDVLSKSNRSQIHTEPVHDVVDSTGSGDIFLAGFAYYFHKGLPIDSSIKFGDNFARKNLMRSGIPPIRDFLD